MSDVLDRINEYLAVGGFFNPEHMEHDKVRDMILDCRDEIERLREQNELLRKAIDDIEFWVADSIAKSRAALGEK